MGKINRNNSVRANIDVKNSTIYGDTTWKADDETNYKRTNLEELNRLNLLEKCLKRETVWDCFSLYIKTNEKTVRFIIPFSPQLNLDNRGVEHKEYEYSQTIGIHKTAPEGSLTKLSEASTEPWMLPEVEEEFKRISYEFPPSNKIPKHRSENIDMLSCTCCERADPIHENKPSQDPALNKEEEKIKDSCVKEHQLQSIEAILDELARGRRVISEELTEFRIRPIDFSSALLLACYPRLLFPVLSSDFSDDLSEVEVIADLTCTQLSKKEEEVDGNTNLVLDDGIQSYPLPRFDVSTNEDRLLYAKISSENIQKIWTDYIFIISSDTEMLKLYRREDKTERIFWSTCGCELCVHAASRKKYEFFNADQKIKATSPINQVSQGRLNAEVPEFFPQKDNYTQHENGNKYFPSASGPSQGTIFPYIISEWNRNNCNHSETSYSMINPTYNQNNYSESNNCQPPFTAHSNLYDQIASQHYAQTHINPQIVQPGSSQNFPVNQQIILGSNRISVCSASGFPSMPDYGVTAPSSMTVQQPWVSTMYVNQNQQQIQSQQLRQLATLHYSSLQLPCLQSQTNELMYHSGTNWPNGTAYPSVFPQMNIEVMQCHSQTLAPESSSSRIQSLPKNIPVFQRPPESYSFSQGESNSRRKNGCGGGAVLTNLIVLTKGNNRSKSTKSKGNDQGSSEREAKQNRSKEKEGKEPKRNIEFDEPDYSRDFSSGGNSSRTKWSTEELISINPPLTDKGMLNQPYVVNSTNKKGFSTKIENPEGEFSKKGIDTMHPQMTSTPKIAKKKEKRDRLRWLDVAISSYCMEENRIFDALNLHIDPSTVYIPGTSDASGQIASEVKVKGCHSDPVVLSAQDYLTPIKRSFGSEASSSASTSDPSCQRRLYRDVLTSTDGSSFQTITDGTSSSSDSLERHFCELEKLALEQYQSSNESLNSIYQELEKQAIQQYRSNSDGDGRALAEPVSTPLKFQDCRTTEDILPTLSHIQNVRELQMCTTTTECREQGHQKTCSPSEHRDNAIYVPPNLESSCSCKAEIYPSSDCENCTENVTELENQYININEEGTMETKKVLIEKREECSGYQGHHSNDSAKGGICDQWENFDSKIQRRTSNDAAMSSVSNFLSLDQPPDGGIGNFSDNDVIGQQETPNEHRTQVSFTAGKKSEEEEEGLAIDAEVPETWVLQHQPNALVAQQSMNESKYSEIKTRKEVLSNVGHHCESEKWSKICWKKTKNEKKSNISKKFTWPHSINKEYRKRETTEAKNSKNDDIFYIRNGTYDARGTSHSGNVHGNVDRLYKSSERIERKNLMNSILGSTIHLRSSKRGNPLPCIRYGSTFQQPVRQTIPPRIMNENNLRSSYPFHSTKSASAPITGLSRLIRKGKKTQKVKTSGTVTSSSCVLQ